MLLVLSLESNAIDCWIVVFFGLLLWILAFFLGGDGVIGVITAAVTADAADAGAVAAADARVVPDATAAAAAALEARVCIDYILDVTTFSVSDFKMK
mmetsp:Transcript_42104/g.88357  ORF Transcript_42104/g.88357 Transcript_42104/m.88357 type:complete len:97 (+) Transcript_42104:2907-3197(+)